MRELFPEQQLQPEEVQHEVKTEARQKWFAEHPTPPQQYNYSADSAEMIPVFEVSHEKGAHDEQGSENNH